MREGVRANWRRFVACIPLPMLALAASYGVYRFALLFVPEWVARIQAAAFEMVYVSLALVRGLGPEQRMRASKISVGAVVVSILYNSLSGFFHTQPGLLASLPWFAWAMLAILHGAPLAWVAYLVSSLLLHADVAPEVAAPSSTAQPPATIVQALPPAEGTPLLEAPATQALLDGVPQVVYLKDVEGLTFGQIGERLGISRQAASQRYSKALQVVREAE